MDNNKFELLKFSLKRHYDKPLYITDKEVAIVMGVTSISDFLCSLTNCDLKASALINGNSIRVSFNKFDFSDSQLAEIKKIVDGKEV